MDDAGSSQTNTNDRVKVETLKADIGRLSDEIKTLASDAVRLPRDAAFSGLETKVRREPLKAVAIAVGAGILIGFILAR